MYNAETQRISAPVGMYDIQQALSKSSPDLMTLCRANNINIWSRMKPCNFPSVDVMIPADYDIAPATDPNIVMERQLKCRPDSHGGTWGIIFPTMQKYDYWISPEDTDANKYLHDAPDGRNMNFARMKDFNGYSHGQPKPLGDLYVLWDDLSFTCIVPFEQDDVYGIAAGELDGNIYEHIGWRPAIMVLRENSFVGLYYCNAETEQNPVMTLSEFPSNTTQITFGGTVPDRGVEYTFVGLLIAYKYVQETTNQLIELKWEKIWASSTDNSSCAIPMPNNRITSVSGNREPVIRIISMQGSNIVPEEGVEGVYSTGNQFLYVTVRYYGGENGYTFYSPSFRIMVGSDGVRYQANNKICQAWQSIEVEYCFGFTGTGQKICTANVICGEYSDNMQKYITFLQTI